VVSLWFFRGVAFRGENFIAADALARHAPWSAPGGEGASAKVGNPELEESATAFFPAYLHAARWIGDGTVPLWNPHAMCGAPFVNSGEAGMFYPLNAPFYMAGAAIEAVNWGAVAHMALAGLFAFCMGRALGMGFRAAAVTGVVFMFNGWLASRMMSPHLLRAGVWLPLMVCLYELSFKRKKASFAVLCGVAGAMPFLAASPQVGMMSQLFVVLYAAFKFFTSGKDKGFAAAAWAVSVVVAAGIASIQTMPSADAIMRSAAQPGALADIVMSPFDIKHLAMIFAPDIYGNPAAGGYHGELDYMSMCAYAGALPLIMAAIAVFRGSGRTRWYFAGAAVLSVIVALGSPLSIIALIIPWRHMPQPREALFVFSFCVSALAGFGWAAVEKDGSFRERASKMALPIIVCAAALAAFMGAAAVAPAGDGGERAGALAIASGAAKWAVFAAAGAAVLTAGFFRAPFRWLLAVAIIMLDIGLWASWLNPTTKPRELFPPTAATDLLQADRSLFRVHGVGSSDVLKPDAASVYGLFDIRGRLDAATARYAKMLDVISEDFRGATVDSAPVPMDVMRFRAPILNLMNVKYALSEEWPADYDDPQFRRMIARDARLTINENALPRFFMVDDWRAMDGPDEALESMLSRDFDPGAVVLLDSREFEGGALPTPPPPAADPDRVGRVPLLIKHFYYSPDFVSFTTVAGRAGMLVASEANAPGWTAAVNGRPVPLYTADYVFRAVPLEAGENHVSFAYKPASVSIGASISAAATAASILALIILSLFYSNSPARKKDRQ
jgi:hypothetical protein